MTDNILIATCFFISFAYLEAVSTPPPAIIIISITIMYASL